MFTLVIAYIKVFVALQAIRFLHGAAFKHPGIEPSRSLYAEQTAMPLHHRRVLLAVVARLWSCAKG